MRIISGSARGKRLLTLSGLDVRPTADRVKEALFNILQFDLAGCRFLDLFAGSGQVGLEAASRGAGQVQLVDASKEAVAVIRKNIAATRLSDRVAVSCRDFRDYLRGTADTFQVVFLDPPYQKGLLQEALALVPGCLSPEGIVMCEHPVAEQLPDKVAGLTRVKGYRYGKIGLSLYRKEEERREAFKMPDAQNR